MSTTITINFNDTKIANTNYRVNQKLEKKKTKPSAKGLFKIIPSIHTFYFCGVNLHIYININNKQKQTK